MAGVHRKAQTAAACYWIVLQVHKTSVIHTLRARSVTARTKLLLLCRPAKHGLSAEALVLCQESASSRQRRALALKQPKGEELSLQPDDFSGSPHCYPDALLVSSVNLSL